jgi:hypothetical protein
VTRKSAYIANPPRGGLLYVYRTVQAVYEPCTSKNGVVPKAVHGASTKVHFRGCAVDLVDRNSSPVPLAERSVGLGTVGMRRVRESS